MHAFAAPCARCVPPIFLDEACVVVADNGVGAVASPCLCSGVGHAGVAQLWRSVCRRERYDGDRDSYLARASGRELDKWIVLGFQLCNKSWVWPSSYAPCVSNGASKSILDSVVPGRAYTWPSLMCKCGQVTGD
jgi:hypothetical protein